MRQVLETKMESRRSNEKRGLKLVKLFALRLGHCEHSCCFCAQSTKTDPAHMPVRALASEEEIKSAIDQAVRGGASEILYATSGGGISSAEHFKTVKIATELASASGLEVAVDCGYLSEQQLNELKFAGATTYVNSVQTARELFPAYCGSHNYDAKVECLASARSMGYRSRTGGVLGMGESPAHRRSFFEELNRLPCDEISVSLFQPMPGTSLAGQAKMSSSDAVSAILELRSVTEKPIYLLGGREQVLRPQDVDVALRALDGTTVGDYLFTQGEPIDQLASRL